jgi:hypothetical protein
MIPSAVTLANGVALSSAERVEYAGVAHTPRWEDPARFTADIAAFCARLQEA